MMREARARATALEVDGRCEQETGRVSGLDREEMSVALTSGGTCRATRALSCLVAPEPGDLVLVAMPGSSAVAYVLAVLEREEGAAVRMCVRSDAELRVEGTLLLSAVKITMTANDLTVSSARALFELVRARVRLRTLDAVADRVLQRVKRAYRFIEESDHVRAGAIDYQARGTLALHAESTLVTAEGLTKLDASQIQLG